MVVRQGRVADCRGEDGEEEEYCCRCCCRCYWGYPARSHSSCPLGGRTEDAKFRTAALKIGGGNVATFRRENYAHQTSEAKSRFGNISTKVQGQFWKNFSTRKKTDTWVMSRNHCQFSTLFQSLHNDDLPRDLPPDDEFALRSREDLL